MSTTRLLIDFIGYQAKASGKFRVHSPFVYQFFTEIIRDTNRYADYQDIEDLVDAMKNERQLLETTGFGASSGGLAYQTNYERVGKIVKTSSVQRRTGRLLYRIARNAKAGNIIELGTSLGISTMYLAKGAPQAVIHSLEGCSAKTTRAERNFNKLGITNVRNHIGHFDILLDQVISEIDTIDILFMDGNHRQEPTLKYFELCLEKAGNDSIFIFDDIRWSQGMKNAWETIKTNPRVSVSIDLFNIGLVFFRKESSKQDFLLKF